MQVPSNFAIARYLAPTVTAALLLAVACQEPHAETDAVDELGVQTNVRSENLACNVTKLAASAPRARFSEIVALAVDSRGRIYVGDAQKRAITVLSSSGSVLGAVGRKGAGPGEFGGIATIQILPGDSLLVYDWRLERMTVFVPYSDSVAYVRNFVVTSSVRPPDWVVKIPGREQILVRTNRPYHASDNPAEDDERVDVFHLLNAHSLSIRRDSVLVVPSEQQLIARPGRIIVSRTDYPFGRRPVIHVAPDDERIYYGWTDSLTIQIFNMHGQRVGGFSAHYRTVPVTDEDIEDYFADMSERSKKWFLPVVEEYDHETWPAFKDFIVDQKGRIWVGMMSRPDEPTRWVAFTKTGSRVCSVTFPANVELRLIKSGRAYGVATSQLNVPRVVVYGLGQMKRRPAGGA